MRAMLGSFRNIALVAFAAVSLAKPAQAQPTEACYGCGSCTCCDINGEVACIIVCGDRYCDCCGTEECTGNACN